MSNDCAILNFNMYELCNLKNLLCGKKTFQSKEITPIKKKEKKIENI